MVKTVITSWLSFYLALYNPCLVSWQVQVTGDNNFTAMGIVQELKDDGLMDEGVGFRTCDDDRLDRDHKKLIQSGRRGVRNGMRVYFNRFLFVIVAILSLFPSAQATASGPLLATNGSLQGGSSTAPLWTYVLGAIGAIVGVIGIFVSIVKCMHERRRERIQTESSRAAELRFQRTLELAFQRLSSSQDDVETGSAPGAVQHTAQDIVGDEGETAIAPCHAIDVDVAAPIQCAGLCEGRGDTSS